MSEIRYKIHVAGPVMSDGNQCCGKCGEPIPPKFQLDKPFPFGERVGVALNGAAPMALVWHGPDLESDEELCRSR